MRIIAGFLGGRTLKTAEGPGYRPAMSRVREALFSMLESRGVAWRSTRCLDLFAGSGSLGFEAVSRGAPEVWFVESGKEAATVLRGNATRLGLWPERADGVRVAEEECGRFLRSRAAHPFELVFIDPPYGDDVLTPTVRMLLKNGWLAPEGIVTAEVSARAALDAEGMDGRLGVLADRLYGQTRIVLWSMQREK